MRAPFYRYEQAKLQCVKREYDATALNFVRLQTALRPGTSRWFEQLETAQRAGALTEQCDPIWQEAAEARKLKVLLDQYHHGQKIPFDSVQLAVNGLSYLLRVNSTDLPTEPSQILKETFDDLQKVISITRDSGNDTWSEQLKTAQKAGVLTKQCDSIWEKSKVAVKIKVVLNKYHNGQGISFESLQLAVEALNSLLRVNSTELPTKPSHSLKKTFDDLHQVIFFARDFSQFRRIQLYNNRQFHYPGDMNQGLDVSPQNVLYPTAMGNIGSTIRSYAISRYSLDLDIFWSRLQNAVQTDKDYFGTLQDVKVQLDFLVALIWLTGIFAIVWTPIAFFRGTLLEFLAVGASGFLPLILYSIGCDTYLLFADLMRGAVDLFRFKLAGNFHLPLPGSTEEEQLFWTRLGNVIGYSREERLSYKHSGS
jgi:hypothetical protein